MREISAQYCARFPPQRSRHEKDMQFHDLSDGEEILQLPLDQFVAPSAPPTLFNRPRVRRGLNRG
jgi:hypothetical protein